MKSKPFSALVTARLEACQQTLGIKAGEYMQDDDRHWNFKQAGAILGCSPEEALLGMLAKHIVSVLDLARASGRGEVPSKELVKEKIGDWICYGVLLEGLFEERRATKEARSCQNCAICTRCDEEIVSDCCSRWRPA
ncbi:MAG TPA: hypothetical protein VN455_10665 [Methanotrichaceae archaeon]|nr:hypothetical protein [Methanotrichaceae archaeon]